MILLLRESKLLKEKRTGLKLPNGCKKITFSSLRSMSNQRKFANYRTKFRNYKMSLMQGKLKL